MFGEIVSRTPTVTRYSATVRVGLCGAAGERGQLGTLADGNHVLIGGLALLY